MLNLTLIFGRFLDGAHRLLNLPAPFWVLVGCSVFACLLICGVGRKVRF